MTQFLSHPRFQAFDSNGDPLNGGKVHTYEVGTTTNKATYPTIADAEAATNANANPVVLDSRGEADIVLAGSTKIVLKDSDDNTIWTLDNIDTDATTIDANGNQVVEYGSTASAVNHIKIINAATGNAPTIQSAGENNIGVVFENSESEEILILSSTATSVNEVTITSQATGTGPSIAATGDDTNIDLNLQAKGTGVYNLKSTSDQETKVRLFEDTDNGSNYVELTVPSSITSNRTVTFPDSAIDFGEQLIKIWCKFDGTGTPAVTDSHNVTSITDNGTGDYTVNFSITLASSSYVVVTSPQRSSIALETMWFVSPNTPGTTSVGIESILIDNDAPSTTLGDVSAIQIAIIGGE